MKNILKKIIAVYVIIASLAILLKIGDVYAEQVGDFPNQLCTRLSEDMIYGSTDQSASGQVTSLQRFLVNRGYSIGSDAFGVFGYGTQDAVSKFQTNSNLIPTGFVGENTRTVIQNISCGTTPYSNLPSTVQVSNIPNNVCGVNTGWTWNGRECVSLCDINHPWDPNQSKCSNSYGVGNYTYYTPNSTSCAGYGPNYFFNGRYCVTSSNMNYCGADSQYTWNGSSCVERYTIQYLCTTNGQYYTDKNLCPASVATSSNNAYGYNGFAGYQYSSYGSTYTNTTPVNTNTTYTFVPTYSTSNTNTYTANPTTYYLGNNTPCQDWYPCQKEKPGVSITQYVYTYTTTSYPGSSYYNYNSYPNYNYLGSTGSQYYNDYFNCDYNQYINTGYYDIYGIYHY